MGIYDDGYNFDSSEYSEDLLDNPGTGLSDTSDWSSAFNSGNTSFTTNQPESTGYQDPNIWGSNGYQTSEDGTQFWQGPDGNYVGFKTPTGDFTPYQQDTNTMGGIQQALSSIFSGNNGKMFSTGLSAVLSGMQNKKKADALNKLAQQLKTSGDPFGSQRGFYQQELLRTMQNPYSSPMVSAQIDQINKAQAIKDAAAGRRSNSATSNPAVLAAMAQVAQEYMKSLYGPAGVNINPDMSGYTQASMAGVNSGIDGYISPLASALGFNQQSSNNQQVLEKLLKKLGGN